MKQSTGLAASMMRYKTGGTIDGFDPRSVTETEVDAIRQVDWGPEVGLRLSLEDILTGLLMLMVQ